MEKGSVGQRIAEMRRAKGITQRELAKSTNGRIGQTQLANYEQGTREPGLDEIEALAAALRTTPGFLAGFTRLPVPLSDTELRLIQTLRRLPENERNDFFNKISSIGALYREPIPDSRLNIPKPPKKHTVKQ